MALEQYKLIVRHIALEDLREIYTHISRDLNETMAAERIHRAIIEAVSGLSSMPLHHPLIADEPYRTAGYRILLVKSYIIFYIVDQNNKRVHIVRVLYNRRDWQNLL